MLKHIIATLLFAKSSHPIGDELHAAAGRPGFHAGPGDLTADERERIAAQVRAIATRACDDYRRRHEPVPPYVLSAMRCGLNASKGQQNIWNFSTKELLFSFGVVILLAALIPLAVKGLRRNPGEQNEQARQHQLQQELQDQLQALKQQRLDMLHNADYVRNQLVSHLRV